MAEMMQIGIKCAEKSIKVRPKMTAVVKIAEDLIVMNIGASVSSRRKLVVLDANPTFDLSCILILFRKIW